MLIEILRPVLIGSRVHKPGDRPELPKAVGQRLTTGTNPAARVIEDREQPQIVLQSQQSIAQPALPDSPPLSLEGLVAMGVPPKVARLLIDAGIHSREQLTLEGLLAIEGIGEKTAEMIVALITKPE